MLLAMPVVVAVKVAAQYRPDFGTVHEFLAPNGRSPGRQTSATSGH
jgi:hypothetical protein